MATAFARVLLLVSLWLAATPLAAQRAEPLLSASPRRVVPASQAGTAAGATVEQRDSWPRGLRGALIGAAIGGLYGYFALRGECTGDQQCNRAQGVLVFGGMGALAGALIDAIASGGHSLTRAMARPPGPEENGSTGNPRLRGPRRSG
ncbi:MAG TPA: hypothetical protein VGE02_00215 [Gemmatimonadales bacterium]